MILGKIISLEKTFEEKCTHTTKSLNVNRIIEING